MFNILGIKLDLVHVIIVIGSSVFALVLSKAITKVQISEYEEEKNLKENLKNELNNNLVELKDICTKEEFELFKIKIEKEFYENKKVLKKESFASRVNVGFE